MDYSLENHKSYVGRPTSELPTPSLVINLPVLKSNIDTLHHDVEKLGIGFRPHIKTLKSLEVTRLMLADGKYKSIVASTIPEIQGCLPLVKEGLLNECLYSLPIHPGVIPRLVQLRKSLNVLLMVDNEQQISALEESSPTHPWDIFIKLDVGSHRAGVAADSPALQRLVQRAESSPSVRIYGFYCHAGHSYAGRSHADAEDVLNVEVSSVLSAAKLLPADRPLVISVGATPTAHVIQNLKASIPSNIQFELHAGNFPTNDLQQVSTGLVAEAQQAVSVATEVCSVYPERNEALVNAGVIAMSRETSGFSGFGQVVGKPGWGVVRMSQEHGILGTVEEGRKVEEEFKVGQRVDLWCNHSCITAAAFYVYYVVDGQGISSWLLLHPNISFTPFTGIKAHQQPPSPITTPLLSHQSTMSYADVAASGPKQSPEDAAAPQPPEVISTESASTASLVDVDLPSVHTVTSDFLDQPVKTETQAARIEREEAARDEKRKRDQAAAKAHRTDNWLIQQFSRLSDGTTTSLAVVNLASVVGLGAYLGYKGWGLYEKGRLDWKAVGIGAGIIAGVGAVQGVVGRYLYKGKKGGS
ncbi:hypothetical protein ACJZ2D_000224 [Fusarium nematophilum]